MIYISGLITSHGGIQDGTSFANQVLILTEEKIQSAAACQTENMNNPEASRHTSTSGLFFRKIETSCSAIDHSSATAKYNKCLMFSMCARYGIPGIFFCCKNIPCIKESQLFPLAVPATLTPNNDAVLRGPSLMIISWIKRSNTFDSAIKSIQLLVTIGPWSVPTYSTYIPYICMLRMTLGALTWCRRGLSNPYNEPDEQIIHPKYLSNFPFFRTLDVLKAPSH